LHASRIASQDFGGSGGVRFAALIPGISQRIHPPLSNKSSIVRRTGVQLLNR